MNKKLKILFLTRSFYPNIGGVEKHVLEISKILVQKGHNVAVITERPQKSYSKSYHSDNDSAKKMGKTKNIRTIYIDTGSSNWFKKFRVWKELLKHATLIYSFDIIHCHDVFFWYLPFRFFFPFKKVFTTFHGYEGNNLPTIKAVIMHKISEKLSNGNICVGDFLKKWYGTKPTFVTYGAVDKNLILLGQTKKRKISNRIVFVGRLEKETGILTYLKALNLLQKDLLSLEMDVYGKGSLENEVVSYSQKNNLKVNMKGFVSNIESVLNDYEYVFCSRYLSILESLALKQFIFAEYNNEIKKDYLQMSPFSKYIFISKSPNEIADALKAHLLNKKIFDSNKGYNWVKDKTWEYMVNLYLKLWNLS